MSASGDAALFWELVRDDLESGTLERGTLMGFPCVRTGGEFVAMPHHRTGALILRLPPARVDALVAEGVGEPFGPGKRVFKGWMAVPERDEAVWRDLIGQATEHQRSGGGR